MIITITNILLNYIIKNNLVDSSDEKSVKFYRYGIEITVSSILNIVLILIAGFLLNGFVAALIFLAVFIPLRQYTGGFHASTYFRCNLTFLLVFFITFLSAKYTYNFINTFSAASMLVIGLAVIDLFCPVENEKKPIKSESQRRKCKILAISIYLICSVISLILIYFNVRFGNVVLYTLQAIVVLVIVGKITERRSKS